MSGQNLVKKELNVLKCTQQGTAYLILFLGGGLSKLWRMAYIADKYLFKRKIGLFQIYY